MGWRDLIAQADEAIDGQWGEQVRFLPYKAGNYMTATVPDSSRSEADFVAVVYRRGSGMRTGSASATMMAKRLEADYLCSVQGRYLPDVREKDRVRLIERDNQVCEIGPIEIGSNGRYLLHLVKNVST